MIEYTAEETARFLHRLEDRLIALEKTRVDVPTLPNAVTINEAATFFGVSRRTIYNWIAGRKLQIGRTPGGNVRVYTDSLTLSEGSISVD